MSSKSEAATAETSRVRAVESIESCWWGGGVPLVVVGRCQVEPFGDEALGLQEVLPRRWEAVDAAARVGNKWMTTVDCRGCLSDVG